MDTAAIEFEERESDDQGGAGDATLRKIGMLIELVLHKQLLFSRYQDQYGGKRRSFQRDLQQLRAAGRDYGFRISKIKDGERVELLDFKGPRAIDAAGAAQRAILAELAGSLGTPIAQELGATAGDNPATPGAFIRLITPRLAESSDSVYAALKAAWAAKPAPAIVAFEFEDNKGARSQRRVEPYRVLLRSGRDYLLGYDLGRRAWRTFGIDRICSRPRRDGTIQHLRAIPPEYDSNDAVGFFKSGGPKLSVTVELEREVAASVTSREWQAAQQVERLPRGRARITFEVSDLAEVVRWALGLGPAARVVAPPAAVQLARSTVDEIARRYVQSST